MTRYVRGTKLVYKYDHNAHISRNGHNPHSEHNPNGSYNLRRDQSVNQRHQQAPSPNPVHEDISRYTQKRVQVYDPEENKKPSSWRDYHEIQPALPVLPAQSSTKRKPSANRRDARVHRQPLAPPSWKFSSLLPSWPALRLLSGKSLPHMPLPRVKVHIPYKILAPLICLFAIVGLLISGIYYVELNFLQPLSQLFHPIDGLTSPGSIDGRAWNLLLLGSDTDNKYTFPSVLTQVMIVARIDPYKKSVSLVSIPRNSWVPVPGTAQMHKIDQAFFLGAVAHNKFDDGVLSARATIMQDYGISIDRYAWIGLGGFAKVINTLGGVDLDLTHPVLDDAYPNDIGKGSNSRDPYALKRLSLAPGPQHLDGNMALEYVRSRHADLVGDIGRTQRQQEVLEALKKRLTLPAIFNHLSSLAHDLAGQVYTDLSQGELLSLANFAHDLPTSDVHRLTLGPGKGKTNFGSYAKVYDSTVGEQQDVIIPNCANIQPVINRIFDLMYDENCQSSQG